MCGVWRDTWCLHCLKWTKSSLITFYRHSGSDLLEDASFLDRTSSSADNNNHNDANNTPMLELHSSNVLRMEVEELYKECRLSDLDSVGWGSFAREYVDYLSRLVERSRAIPVVCKNLKETPFCPSGAWMKNRNLPF